MSEHEKTLQDWLALYAKHGTLTAGPLACLDALLAEHAKALVRARNEGLQLAISAVTVAVGDALREYLKTPEPHDYIIGTAIRAAQNAIQISMGSES